MGIGIANSMIKTIHREGVVLIMTNRLGHTMGRLNLNTILLAMLLPATIIVFAAASQAWSDYYGGPGTGPYPSYRPHHGPHPYQVYRPWPGPYYRPFYRPLPRIYYAPGPVYVYPPSVIYTPPPPIIIVPNRAYAYPDPPPPPRPSPSPPPSPAAVLQPVYFDLNKSDIRPDAAKVLRQNLMWFKQNPGRRVSIQGNCDPRATEQYNAALGKRRAEATKEYLVRLGVDGALLETVSYGKGRSTCKGKDESCWAKERRVDFVPVH